MKSQAGNLIQIIPTIDFKDYNMLYKFRLSRKPEKTYYSNLTSIMEQKEIKAKLALII